MRKQAAAKRDVFAELVEGVESMKAHREGKVTLRTHKVAAAEDQAVEDSEAPGPEYFVALRERFNVSRAVWAQMLHVSPRTVEKWEQGGQASSLATTFVELVSRYPDTIERLRTLPRRTGRSASRKTSAVRAIPGKARQSSPGRGASRKRLED